MSAPIKVREGKSTFYVCQWCGYFQEPGTSCANCDELEQYDDEIDPDDEYLRDEE